MTTINSELRISRIATNHSSSLYAGRLGLQYDGAASRHFDGELSVNPLVLGPIDRFLLIVSSGPFQVEISDDSGTTTHLVRGLWLTYLTATSVTLRMDPVTNTPVTLRTVDWA